MTAGTYLPNWVYENLLIVIKDTLFIYDISISPRQFIIVQKYTLKIISKLYNQTYDHIPPNPRFSKILKSYL